MLSVRCVLCGVVFLGAVVCADAVAAETGRIEVEVVYKDTGEPVGSVLVVAGRGDRLVWVRAEAASGGRLSVPVGTKPPGYTYSVQIRNITLHSPWGDAKSSTFVDTFAQHLQEVAFSPGEDVAKVRFEVERGWRLRGTVRRDDGTPLAGGSVVVTQRDSGCRRAFSLTEADGSFDMLGVAPAECAQVIVFAARSRSKDVVDSAPLIRRSIALTGESTSLDLEVQTVWVTLVVDVVKPLWPFSTQMPEHYCVAQLCVGRRSEAQLPFPDMRILFTESSSERRALQTTQYNVSLGELPAQTTFTTEVGFARPDAVSQTPWRLSSCSTTTVELATGNETIRLRVYEPGARLSRALWFAVLPAVVLAVCVPVLVRQARRRRHAQSSTFRQDELD